MKYKKNKDFRRRLAAKVLPSLKRTDEPGSYISRDDESSEALQMQRSATPFLLPIVMYYITQFGFVNNYISNSIHRYPLFAFD